jgi:hypothetical protein
VSVQTDDLIKGTVDLHYHSGPSPFPRRLDPAESARHYDDYGFKAVVYKSHHHNTVMDILSIKKSVLDHLQVRVFGGIALNGLVGGLNPRAVEMCLRMGGKVVWFPTISSPSHLEYHHGGGSFPQATMQLREEAPNSVFGEDGKLKPAVHDIIQLIKEEDAILAAGHMSPPEIFAVFDAARQVGVERLLVLHPEFVVNLSPDQCRELAQKGAFIEHEVGMYGRDRPDWPIEQLINWINAVGVEHTTLGSDTGQATAPLPAEIFGKVAHQLVDNGVPERDVRRMLSDNPGSLLGV